MPVARKKEDKRTMVCLYLQAQIVFLPLLSRQSKHSLRKVLSVLGWPGSRSLWPRITFLAVHELAGNFLEHELIRVFTGAPKVMAISR